MVEKKQYGAVPPPPPTDHYRPSDSAARQRVRRRRVSGGQQGGLILVIAAVVLVGLMIVSTLGVILWVASQEDNQEVLPTAVLDLPTAVAARVEPPDLDNLPPGAALSLPDGGSILLEPWDGTSRFTILVMGLDRRPGETGLAFRTDTIMLVSINPADSSIGILSIPRDLYVPVPGYSQLQRINTPMVLGELRCTGCGPELAMQTVQNNMGIRVNEYAAVDFNGFIKFIDAIGGIEVTVNYNISDRTYPNMYYGYDPFYLPAGTHQLDGATALKFARTRHGSSDFQRAQRQQQVLYAIRDRLLEPDVLPQLILQSPTLYAQFQENISTGLTLDQMLQLTLYLKDVPVENIRTGVVDQRYTQPYTTKTGAQVLVPNRARLGALMVEVFGADYNQ